MAASLWTVRFSSGEELSNLSSRDIKELAQSGKLQPTDLVWREGMEDWAKAKRLKGLFQTNKQQAKVPSQSTVPLVSPPASASEPQSVLPLDPVAVATPVQTIEPQVPQKPEEPAVESAGFTESDSTLNRIAIITSRWPYRSALLFSLAFICLPWFSYSYFSAGINFNDGTTELNIPETAGNVTLYGIASNSGIISFLVGLLAIGISYFNRWLPGNTLKAASCLIAPVVFIVAWAYFFNVAGDATGIDVRTASMSADASFGPGFWLFLVSSIALAGLAVTTDWTRHNRPVPAGSPMTGPAAEQGARSGQASLHKWVFAVILPILAMMILCGGLLSQILSLFESANESMQNLDALNQSYESSPAGETDSDSTAPSNPEQDSDF